MFFRTEGALKKEEMSPSPRPRILIVDDEPMNVELLQAYLTAEYDIIPAYCGSEALQLVVKERPDLVLLDVMMPGLNGYKVCEQIKKSSETHFIPVVLVTALSSREDRLKGIECHADDFLTKPVDRLELRMRVTSLLRIKSLHDKVIYERDQAQNYLDIAGVMMLVLDRDQRVTLVNRRAMDILGCEESDIMERSWFNTFVPQPSGNEARQHYIKAMGLENGAELYYEGPLMTKNGEERIVSWCSKSIQDKEGNSLGVLSSGEDITLKKEAEKQLKQYAQNLKYSNDLKDLFIDIMAHDLMNPAGIAKGFAGMLLHAEDNNDKIRKLRIIDDNISRLINMIESTAHFARLEDTDNLEFRVLDLGPIIRDAADSFTTLMAEKNITMDIRLNGHYPARVNPLVEGVFTNYISNAIKYGPANSSIIIEIGDLGTEWKVNVQDFGDGISDTDKELVFDRFKRLTQKRKGIKGAGLGLAIARRVVDLHGGRVGIEDGPAGIGSVFWATFKKGE
ncbi:MAG: hypothetical protein PWP63_1288 [Methanolobus sp.]|nr:hypothetical protein [Methanolobus sp.]